MERYWVTHCEWHSNLKDASADDGRDVEVVLYADAQATVEALQREVANLKACQCDGCAETLEENDVYCEKCWTRQQTALDAEREKVKGLHEATKVICGHCCESMEIPSKAALQSHLSTLQGLVRAISETMEPFRLSLAKLDEVDTLATRRIAEADAYYCAQRVLSTLPATPTEEAPVKGGDGE